MQNEQDMTQAMCFQPQADDSIAQGFIFSESYLLIFRRG